MALCFLAAAAILAAGSSSKAQGVCPAGNSTGPVQAPVFVTNLSGQTSWFASPVVIDLDGNGSNELVAAYYDVYVFGSDGSLLDRADDGDSRVYAPHVVADLDGDGITEVVAGRGHLVWAWEWNGSALVVKSGWPADTTTGGNSPEIRGMASGDLDGNGAPAAPAVGDLDGDGQLEVFVQTFDHGLDVFTIPGSAANCLMWPTARGGPLRSGQAVLRWREGIFFDGFESATVSAWSNVVP